MRKSFLVAAIVFILWGVGVFLSYDFAFFSAAVTQFFATGRTFFKEYFFFAWAILFFLVMALPIKSPGKNWGPWLLVSVGAAALLSLAAHCWYTWMYGLGLGNYSIAVDGQYLSSNNLVHTHVLKAMVAFLMRLVEIPPDSVRADSGQPFLSILPTWFVVVSLLVVFVSMLLILVVALEKRKAWSKPGSWPYWIAFAVSSYAVWRCLFDGGPFSTEFLVYSPPFAYLSLKTPSSPSSLLRKMIPFWIWGFALTLALGLVFSIQNLGSDLVFIILFSAFFSLLLLAVEWASLGKSCRGWRHLLWLTPLVVALSYVHFWAVAFRYLNQPIAPGTRFFVSDWLGKEYPFPVQAREGSFKVQTDVATAPSSVWAIHRYFQISPNYFLVSVPNQNCVVGQSYSRQGTVKVVEGQLTSRDFPSPLFEFFRIEPCGPGESCTYRFDVNVRGCIQDTVFQSVITHFKTLGLKKFIVVPKEI